MIKKQTGTAHNLLRDIHGGPKMVRVYATTDSPDSSYGIPVWVSSKGQSFGQVGLPKLGWKIIADDPEFDAKHTMSGWGGARPGAGRPPISDEKRTPRAIRLTDAEYNKVKEFLTELRGK